MRFLLSGYYGCGNAGDEAVLGGIVKSLQEQEGGGAQICALSANPAETRATHGIEAADRMHTPTLRTEINQCDLFISGGGSLLQDVTSLKSLLYYLWVIRMARTRRKPVMIYAQGMGPLRRPAARILTGRVLQRANFITVRDEASKALLQRIGVSKPEIEVTADPAFCLDPMDGTADRILAQAGLDSGSRPIIVALRSWPGLSSKVVGQALSQLAQATGSPVLAVALHHPDDLVFSQAVAAESAGQVQVVQQALQPGELIGLMGAARMVVAMRLHALIFGAMATSPLLALSYDPKVDALMNRLGLAGNLIGATDEGLGGLCPVADSVLANEEAARQQLAARSAEMRKLAQRNAEIAIKLVTRRPN
jgi:polysaccharide pyruvyl transferase CsaB